MRRLPREVSLPWYVLSSSRHITSTTPQTPCSLLSVVMVSLASLVQLIYMSTMLLLLLSLFTVLRMLSLTAIAVYNDSICVFFITYVIFIGFILPFLRLFLSTFTLNVFYSHIYSMYLPFPTLSSIPYSHNN